MKNANGNRAKILIGTPCGATILTVTTLYLMKMHDRLRNIGAQPGWAKAEGTYVCQNQNALAQQAIDGDADALMLIDSDMTGSETIPERLWAHDKDIIGCDYRIRSAPHAMAARKLADKQRPTGEETGLEKMAFMPTGCLMIRLKVLTTLSYPWFFLTYGSKPSEFQGNDANFCFKARDAGFDIWCDHDMSNELYHNGLLPLARQYEDN